MMHIASNNALFITADEILHSHSKRCLGGVFAHLGLSCSQLSDLLSDMSACRSQTKLIKLLSFSGSSVGVNKKHQSGLINSLQL